MATRLLLYYCIISISFACRMNTSDIGVKPKEHYMYFNESHCFIWNHQMQNKTEHQPYFLIQNQTKPISCNLDKHNKYTVEAPLYILSGLSDKTLNDKIYFSNRRCQFNTCYVTVDITKQWDPEGNKTDRVKNSGATQNLDESDPNFYTYVGIGVAVILMIVLFQSGCIVWYSRKVANTRRVLQSVLNVREERREANDRYSVGPVLKKSTVPTERTDQEEDLYESLEIPSTVAAKGDKDTFKSMKNRPPMPLPHEMKNFELKNDGKKRPPMPLPHEMPSSEFNVNTLPHKTSSKGAYFDRLPEQLANATMPHPHKKSSKLERSDILSPVRGFPPCYPPNQAQFKSNALLRYREQPPDPTPPTVAAPLVASNVLPNYPSSSKNKVSQGSHEISPIPAAPSKAMSPRLGPKVESRKPAPSSITSELNEILKKKHLLPVDQINLNRSESNESLSYEKSVAPESNSHENSSDEEWTYEKLPPRNKYLH